MERKIQLGQLVYSITGRDCNSHYVVVGFSSDNFVLLADGRRRKTKNPKKKNLRHIKAFEKEDCILDLSLYKGKQLDERVKSFLSENQHV